MQRNPKYPHVPYVFNCNYLTGKYNHNVWSSIIRQQIFNILNYHVKYYCHACCTCRLPWELKVTQARTQTVGSDQLTEEVCDLSSCLLLVKSRWMHTWIAKHVFPQLWCTLHTFTHTHACNEHTAHLQIWSDAQENGRDSKKKKVSVSHLYPAAWQKPVHTFLLLSPPLASLTPSVSCFLASSGSSKQESSPNDGIKRVRKMTEKEKEKECGRRLFCSTTPTDSELQRKRNETARDSVPLVNSLCLFLATALLLSVDQTSVDEG